MAVQRKFQIKSNARCMLKCMWPYWSILPSWQKNGCWLWKLWKRNRVPLTPCTSSLSGVQRWAGLTGRWQIWTEAICTAVISRKPPRSSLRSDLSGCRHPVCCREMMDPSLRQPQPSLYPRTSVGSTWTSWLGNILPSSYRTTDLSSPPQRILTAPDI